MSKKNNIFSKDFKYDDHILMIVGIIIVLVGVLTTIDIINFEEEINGEIQNNNSLVGIFLIVVGIGSILISYFKLKKKKELKEKDDDDHTPNGGSGTPKEKTIKISTSDPESGWFRKGEHKEVFAYAIETACDKFGWILGYTVNPGNLHDSRTFKGLYDKIKNIGLDIVTMDSGYRTPAIAKLLIDDGLTPLFPYKRPMTKDGFFKKYEFVYDEHYDCYICPNDQILSYSTTNRDGYREYKSCGHVCAGCPYLSKCTESKDHVKLVTRHIWEEYMEMCEDIRHTNGMKEVYSERKQTIERLFGSAKENHGFRYTQLVGKARMEMKVGLTFACMNLKKLAGILRRREEKGICMA